MNWDKSQVSNICGLQQMIHISRSSGLTEGQQSRGLRNLEKMEKKPVSGVDQEICSGKPRMTWKSDGIVTTNDSPEYCSLCSHCRTSITLWNYSHSADSKQMICFFTQLLLLPSLSLMHSHSTNALTCAHTHTRTHTHTPPQPLSLWIPGILTALSCPSQSQSVSLSLSILLSCPSTRTF